MIVGADLADGMQLAAGFFGLTILLAFAFGLLFGFVRFMKRMLG
jgi:hypothetical protein